VKVNQEFSPASGQWECARCRCSLQPGQVELVYLGNSFTVGVQVCPQCNQALIPEEMATRKMLEVEKILEDK
jgi:hypothetical protein